MNMINNKEIKKLKDYFDLNHDEYEVVKWEDDQFNLHVDLEYIRLSFLTSNFSLGGHKGLIEFYNFRDEPAGYLTADEAIEIYEDIILKNSWWVES